MPSFRHQPTRALLLRSIDYGESDRIVTLLTERFGKLRVFARRVRQSQRRFAGALQPYSLLRTSVAMGHGDLGRMSEATMERAFLGILGSLQKMATASAVLELVRETSPERMPDPQVFETTCEALELVERIDGCNEEIELAFGARLLRLLGLAPELMGCAECGRRAETRQAAYFDPSRGSVVCSHCGGGPLLLSAATRQRLDRCLGGPWAAQVETWSERERTEAAAAVEACFSQHYDRLRPRQRTAALQRRVQS